MLVDSMTMVARMPSALPDSVISETYSTLSSVVAFRADNADLDLELNAVRMH
jgi:hypothetical protein